MIVNKIVQFIGIWCLMFIILANVPDTPFWRRSGQAQASSVTHRHFVATLMISANVHELALVEVAAIALAAVEQLA